MLKRLFKVSFYFQELLFFLTVKYNPDNPVYVFTLQRLYKSGNNDDMHKYTLHPDDPDFVRAKINAQQISDVRQLLSILNTSK